MKIEDFNNLKLLLNQFKVITINLIESLEQNDFSSLEFFLKKRENIIEEIDKIYFNSLEFKQICEEISLLPLQKKLTILMNEKRALLNNEINSIKNSKRASNNYNKGYSIDSLYFNKKI